jgi:hypothetical protein
MKSTGLSSEEKKAQTGRKARAILFLLSMAMIVWIFMLLVCLGVSKIELMSTP